MKTKMLLLASFTVLLLHAGEDPFAAVRAALANNQLESAEAALTSLTAVERPDGRAWFSLSRVRARQHKTKEAVALAEKATAASPDNAEFQSNLGVVLGQRMGEVNFMHQAMLAGSMLAAFEKSVQLDPNHLDGYIGLARYYTFAPSIAGGGRAPAERYAREVEQRDAQSGTLEFAHIADHFDDPSRAYELYTKAASDQPNAAWIQQALGRLGEKLHRPADARAHFEKAISLDPNFAPAKAALDRLNANKS